MKIQLIHPPADDWYPEDREILSLRGPPVGLAITAKAVKSSISDCEIEIIDGNETNLDRILENLDADVVGISYWYSKHDNVLAIAKAAKEKGATTVLGGYLNGISDRMLRDYKYIDYVVLGDGTQTLPALVRGNPPQNIPGLVYRDGEGIRGNASGKFDKTVLFDLEDIVKDIVNLKLYEDNPFPISLVNGCIKAEKQGRCSFCSMDQKLSVMDPELAWQQIKVLYEKYGITSLFETGDSFIVGNYPNKLLDARPDDLNHIRFGRIFASPDQLNEDNVQVLRDLNVVQVFLGVESANDHVLEKAGKSYRRADIERSISLLSEYGIIPQAPFMYGLPGETNNSMEETYQFAKDLITKFPNMKILSGHAVPLPGTELFESLRRDDRVKAEYMGDLDRDAHFDYNSLVRLQTKYRTSVDFGTLTGYIKKTKALAPDPKKVGAFAVNGE